MIADASVLILFARAGRLDLLKTLFTTVTIPHAVRDEVFTKGPATPDVRMVEEAARAGWIQTRDVSGETIGRLTERFPNLGLGEVACLALALDVGEDSLLCDDAHARKAARILAIRPIGCLGVLAYAHRSGAIEDRNGLADAVRALLDAGLWVSADVIERFWGRLGRRP